MHNLDMYDVVDKMLLQAHTTQMILASSLDMNDFVRVDSLYLLHGASGSSPTVRSASELLLAHEAPPICMRPPLERTMRLPSSLLAVSLSTEQGAASNDFNVA